MLAICKNQLSPTIKFHTFRHWSIELLEIMVKKVASKPVSRSKAMITVARQNALELLKELDVDLGNGYTCTYTDKSEEATNFAFEVPWLELTENAVFSWRKITWKSYTKRHQNGAGKMMKRVKKLVPSYSIWYWLKMEPKMSVSLLLDGLLKVGIWTNLNLYIIGIIENLGKSRWTRFIPLRNSVYWKCMSTWSGHKSYEGGRSSSREKSHGKSCSYRSSRKCCRRKILPKIRFDIFLSISRLRLPIRLYE